MQKKNLKPLILSALGAVAMAGVAAGATFALFTDKAETTVSVQAGKVEVSSGVTIKKAYSLNASDATSATSETHASYVNGGQADVNTETGNVKIQKWTPGDGIKLRTNPVNGSNVNILSRIRISLVGDLAPALEIRVRSADASDTDDTNVIYGRIGAGQLVSDWVSLAYSETPNNPTAYDVDIVFPDHDNGEIKFGEDNKDNQYMDKTATVVITYEAVQGNADVGANLLERINTTLATESIKDGGMNKTMHDAMEDIAGIATEAQVEAAGYVWGYEDDMFHEFASAPADAYKYFKVADNKAAAGDYSIYASEDWEGAAIDLLGKGFDAGTNDSGITNINYVGIANTARTNIIRSNDQNNTFISINAPLDIVHHYGDALELSIIAVAGDSYHEFGRIRNASIKTGRIVFEEGSQTDKLFLETTTVNTETTFDNIIIAKDENVELPALYRASVGTSDIATEADPLLVCRIETLVEDTVVEPETEYIWLINDGTIDNGNVYVSNSETGQKDVAGATLSGDSAAEQLANNVGAGEVVVDKGAEAEEVFFYGVTSISISAHDRYINLGDSMALEAIITPNHATNKSLIWASTNTDVLTVSNGVVTAVGGGIAKISAQSVSDPSVITYTEFEVIVPVATIGSVVYDSLQGALNAVEEGQTVLLHQDQVLTSGLTFNRDVNATLNLGGHTVSAASDATIDTLLSISNGNLSISNGSFSNEHENQTTTLYGLVFSNGADSESIDNVNITVNGTGLALGNGTNIKSLNANITGYVDCNGDVCHDAIDCRTGSSIGEITGGSYYSLMTQEYLSKKTSGEISKYSWTASYPLRVGGTIHEISGGTFRDCHSGENYANFIQDGGEICLISGGYFGYAEYNQASTCNLFVRYDFKLGVTSITGGTFESGAANKIYDIATGVKYNDFRNAIANGYVLEEAGTVTNYVYFSPSTGMKSYTANVYSVVAAN